MWALIDCNNFFVSCERVFRPDLVNKPVLVLSSNDGCAVSRSNEVKALGIRMGVPKFQIADLIKSKKVYCFSSNFRLYADFSNRVMETISAVVGRERVEQYSIDECFVRGADLKVVDWEEWALNLKNRVEKEVGVPVTVGVAATKTLAKLAVEVAKKDVLGSGTMVWEEGKRAIWEEQYLRQIDVNEVWGIGGQIARKLFQNDIYKIIDFLAKDRGWVKKNYGLVGERTWRELKGDACIEMPEAEVGNRQILRSRSFGEGVKSREEVGRAVAAYMTVAVENLRRKKWRARVVTVFIRTSRFVEKELNYYASFSVGLDEATSYLGDLVKVGEKILDKIWKDGFVYKKAGVILSGLEKEELWQQALLDSDGMTELEELHVTEEKKQQVMRCLEKLNRQYGSRTVNVGRVIGRNREAWKTKSEARSPEYTTNWSELAQVQ